VSTDILFPLLIGGGCLLLVGVVHLLTRARPSRADIRVPEAPADPVVIPTRSPAPALSTWHRQHEASVLDFMQYHDRSHGAAGDDHTGVAGDGDADAGPRHANGATSAETPEPPSPEARDTGTDMPDDGGERTPEVAGGSLEPGGEPELDGTDHRDADTAPSHDIAPEADTAPSHDVAPEADAAGGASEEEVAAALDAAGEAHPAPDMRAELAAMRAAAEAMAEAERRGDMDAHERHERIYLEYREVWLERLWQFAADRDRVAAMRAARAPLSN